MQRNLTATVVEGNGYTRAHAHTHTHTHTTHTTHTHITHTHTHTHTHTILPIKTATENTRNQQYDHNTYTHAGTHTCRERWRERKFFSRGYWNKSRYSTFFASAHPAFGADKNKISTEYQKYNEREPKTVDALAVRKCANSVT